MTDVVLLDSDVFSFFFKRDTRTPPISHNGDHFPNIPDLEVISHTLSRKSAAVASDYASALTGLVSVPMPSISMLMVSPGRRKTGGLRAHPTPSGVPVTITVPGSRVNCRDR